MAPPSLQTTNCPHSHSSPPHLSAGVLTSLLLITIFITFIVMPSVISFTSTIISKLLWEKGIQTFCLALVLFAIFCGFLNNEDPSIRYPDPHPQEANLQPKDEPMDTSVTSTPSPPRQPPMPPSRQTPPRQPTMPPSRQTSVTPSSPPPCQPPMPPSQQTSVTPTPPPPCQPPMPPSSHTLPDRRPMPPSQQTSVTPTPPPSRQTSMPPSLQIPPRHQPPMPPSQQTSATPTPSPPRQPAMPPSPQTPPRQPAIPPSLQTPPPKNLQLPPSPPNPLPDESSSVCRVDEERSSSSDSPDVDARAEIFIAYFRATFLEAA